MVIKQVLLVSYCFFAGAMLLILQIIGGGRDTIYQQRLMDDTPRGIRYVFALHTPSTLFFMFRFLLSIWAIAVVGGSLFLTHYSNKPGKAAFAPEHWPQEATLVLSSEKPTLLVLLHPQCTCSKATLAELERIVAEVGSQVDTRLLFFESLNMDASWVEGDLWERAEDIPGVTLIRDSDGTLIRQFGAFTSGQTLLYDSSGELLFKGGITAARGHEGDNAGKQALLTILKERQNDLNESFVFGCSILGDT